VFLEKSGGFGNSSDGGCAVACLFEQPDKLMAKLSLSVDDQDSCHVKPTFCTARPFQDCDHRASCWSFAESHFE